MIKEFKVFYGETAATREQLDAIEEIVVEQEIGRAWQARIKIPICIAEDGSWGGENEPAYAEFARVRIEARINEEGDFIPLIDGRITSQDPGMSSEPGASTLTLTVQDDTTLLHRTYAANSFSPGQSASDIATTIFSDAELGGMILTESIDAPPDQNAITQQAGTAMQVLRSLMRQHPQFYAYVLPGTEKGKSDCFFVTLPTTPDPDLPELTVTGKERNISGFNIQRNSNSAAGFEGDSLDMDDLSPRSGTSNSSETAPAEGETATAASPGNTRMRRLPPGTSDHADLSATAKGAADRSSYTVTATGSVLPQAYKKILTPYRMIKARVSNSRYSTNYVIFKVTHMLGRSEYTQSFTVKGNAVTPESGGTSCPAASAAVGGAASVSFSIQGSIF